MQRTIAFDSIALQIAGSALRTAEKVAEVTGWILQVMKSGPVRPTREDRIQWIQTLRRVLPKRAEFVALLHTPRGVVIPILSFGRSKGPQLEFHGLQSLNREVYELSDYAIQLRHTLNEFMDLWFDDVRILRLDVCIDVVRPWQQYTNSHMHRTLSKKHGSVMYRGTTIYYQKRGPAYTKLLSYSKKHKNRLLYDLTRTELRFLSQFWRAAKLGKVRDVIDTGIIRADQFIARRTSIKSIEKQLYENLYKLL